MDPRGPQQGLLSPQGLLQPTAACTPTTPDVGLWWVPKPSPQCVTLVPTGARLGSEPAGGMGPGPLSSHRQQRAAPWTGASVGLQAPGSSWAGGVLARLVENPESSCPECLWSSCACCEVSGARGPPRALHKGWVLGWTRVERWVEQPAGRAPEQWPSWQWHGPQPQPRNVAGWLRQSLQVHPLQAAHPDEHGLKKI